MSRRLTVAAVHAAPVFMNKQATIQKVIQLIRQAKEEGIEYLVFPEVFIPGYPYFIQTHPPLQYVNQSVTVGSDGGDLQPILKVCAELRVSICLGLSERAQGGHTLFNSQAFIDRDGTLLGMHRKLQPTHAERTVWACGGGHTLKVWKHGFARVGGLVCWENTMNFARQAMIEDREEIHAAAWPALSTMKGFEQVADIQIEASMKSHALGAQAWVICASNYVDQGTLEWIERELGGQELVKMGGGWSAIIHPTCQVLAGPHSGTKEKLVKAEIDFEDLGMVKVWIDASGHYKRPEVWRMVVDRRPMWPDDEIVADGAGDCSMID